MDTIHLVERPMTDAEFARMNAGFDEHTLARGERIETSERFGYVALDDGQFIGCSSGLAYKHGAAYNGWFYLSDLFVEAPYRGQGVGTRLLRALEERVAELGVTRIWTRTAGHEAVGFYRKQGYVVFFELEGWFAGGGSVVGMRKDMATRTILT